MRIKIKSKFKIKFLSLDRKNKYGNKPINGFDSTSEWRRWCHLYALAKEGKITLLQKHVMFRFKDGSRYEADFIYYRDGEKIVEDVKSPQLRYQPKFLSNKRKMKEQFNLDVLAIHPNTQKIY